MSLIKKIDVEKHFAARRAMMRGRMMPASRPGAERVTPAATAKNSPVLIEAGTEGHFSSSEPHTSAAPDFAASPVPATPRSRQA